MTSRREQTVTYAILGVFSLIALLPIVGIVFTALQDPGGGAGFGRFDGIHPGNFADAWEQGNFGSYLKSSVIVAAVVVSVSSLLSIMAGYAFGMMRFRGSETLFYVILLGLMVPTEAIVVPLYYDFRDLSLTNTYWALILPQIGTSVAFGTFWMRTFFQSGAALAGGGGADRRRLQLADAVARAAAARQAGGADDVPAAVHVDLERVPARARDGQRRGPADGTARPLLLPGPQLLGPVAAGGRRRDRRDARSSSSTSSSSATSSGAWSPAPSRDREMSAVRFTDVQKRYDGVVAVSDLSLDIADGEFMVLVGPSGSGKTTALRMLAGLESISAGEVRIGERVVNQVAPGERDIAMVFQDYALYPQMTVYDNLAFGLKRRKTPKGEIDGRVRKAAASLDIESYLQRKPGQLSGGQAQRVALGRALVRDPQVFLMDEPLSNLDAKLRTRTRGEIKRLQQEVGTTTVYVTHDQVEAMTMGDRIAVMNEGVLEQVGTPEELYEHPANVFVGGFIGSPAMSFFTAAAQAEGDGDAAALRRHRRAAAGRLRPAGGGRGRRAAGMRGGDRRRRRRLRRLDRGRGRLGRGARPRDVRRRERRRRGGRCRPGAGRRPPQRPRDAAAG